MCGSPCWLSGRGTLWSEEPGPTYREPPAGHRDGTTDFCSDEAMPFPPEATLADVGEFGLIAELTKVFSQGEHVMVGPGDDAAVLRIRQGHVVVSTDLLIEGRHFRTDWVEAAD